MSLNQDSPSTGFENDRMGGEGGRGRRRGRGDKERE